MTELTPLIDGDILLHECGWGAQWDGEVAPFSAAQTIVDTKIEQICYEVDATKKPILFFTDSEYLCKKEGRDFVPLFRKQIATTKVYKENRKQSLPFHYYNLLVTLLAEYSCHLAPPSFEADDAMAVVQCSEDPGTTIICSRDKDLRTIPGWHYSWECGKQPSLGPTHTNELGYLRQNGKKVIGYGKKFLFYQILTGDTVDNVPGLKGWGPAKAFPVINECRSIEDLYSTVIRLYEKQLGSDGYYLFQEQAELLYIRQRYEERFNQHIKRLIRNEF